MKERELIKRTSAYKILEQDKKKDLLSHAYMINCPDEIYMRMYLKYLAALILSDREGDRTDNLILSERYSDCSIYPEEGKNIVVANVSELIEQTLIKPLENEKRLFILSDCQNMNAIAQNKLLKTLEEPPKNVIILMGSSRESSILPTVKSRVKILEVPLFSTGDILSVVKEKFGDREDLNLISTACGGLIGSAFEMAKDDDFKVIQQMAFEMLINMNSVKEILEYSEALSSFGKKIKIFLSVLKIIYRDMLMQKSGQSNLILNKVKYVEIVKAAACYDTGAILAAIEKINNAEQNLYYNANINMQIESLLLSIMEVKYKWLKL
jgi:DNA polymerase-3 subunit delta'